MTPREIAESFTKGNLGTRDAGWMDSRGLELGEAYLDLEAALREIRDFGDDRSKRIAHDCLKKFESANDKAGE